MSQDLQVVNGYLRLFRAGQQARIDGIELGPDAHAEAKAGWQFQEELEKRRLEAQREIMPSGDAKLSDDGLWLV